MTIYKKTYIFLIFINYFCFSQNPKYFISDYGWEYVQNGYRIFEVEDRYVLIGEFLYQNSERWGGYSLSIDRYGDVHSLDTLAESNYSISFINAVQNNNTLDIVGFKRNIANNEGIINSYMWNDSGALISGKEIITTDYPNIAYTISNSVYIGHIFGGEVWTDRNDPNPSFSDLHLIHVDEISNEVWSKTYYYSGYCKINKIISASSTESYYILASINWFAGSGDLLLLNVDAEGNKKWEQIYDLEEEDRARNMIATQDGGFLISGVTDNRPWSYLLKVDDLGNTEWKKKLEGMFFASSVSSMVQLEDGSYVLTGSNWNYLLGGDKDLEIAKVDENGNLLWQRFYGGDKNDYGYDIITANNEADGLDGFVISGRTESLPEPGANVYLVKTNCLGLLTEPQTSFSAEQDPDQPLTYHFTNHSQYVYPDSIDGGHFLWDFGDGTTSEELHPSHIFAEKGESYIVTLTAVVCSDTSVMDIKVVAGEEVVGIDEMEGLPAFSFKLYPNPVSDGQLRVEYDLPKEGRLELYDLQGRLIKNEKLKVEDAHLTMDIGGLVEGMYLYRLVSEGRTLKNGKILCRPVPRTR